MLSYRTILTSMAAVTLACGGDSTTGDAGPDGSLPADSGIDVTGNMDSGADGAIMEASSDAPVNDTGTGTDAAPGTITCGTSSCSVPSEWCCVDPGPPLTQDCTTLDAGACTPGAVFVQCRSAADCPSTEVCCIHASSDPASILCATTCSGANDALVCDPTATDAKNKCGDAGACGNTNIDSWNLTTAFGTCGDQTGPF